MFPSYIACLIRFPPFSFYFLSKRIQLQFSNKKFNEFSWMCFISPFTTLNLSFLKLDSKFTALLVSLLVAKLLANFYPHRFLISFLVVSGLIQSSRALWTLNLLSYCKIDNQKMAKIIRVSRSSENWKINFNELSKILQLAFSVCWLSSCSQNET